MLRRTYTIIIVLLIFVSVGMNGCGGVEERKNRHWERGLALYSEGDYVKARLEFKNVLQIDPIHIGSLYHLGQLAEQNKEWRHAFSFYRRINQVAPEHESALLGMARLYVRGGEPEMVLEHAEKVLALDANNPDAFMLRAIALDKLGDKSSAFSDAAKALMLDPANSDATAYLARDSIEKGDIEHALKLLESGVEANPRNLALKEILIQVYQKSGDTGKAESILKELVLQEPSPLFPRLALANFYAINNRIDEAEGVLRKAISDMPENDAIKGILIRFLSVYRSLGISVKQLETFANQNKDNHKLQLDLANLYLAQRKPEKAREVLTGLVASEGSTQYAITARNQLTTLLLRNNEIDDAQRLIDEILKLNEDDNTALLNRAKIALIQKDGDQAIADLRTVLRDKPNSVDAYRLLANAYLLNGNKELARETLKKAVTINPGSEQIALQLSRLLNQQGNSNSAIDVLQKFLAHRPKNLQALRRVAEIEFSRRDWLSSLETAKRIQQLYPENYIGYLLEGMVYYVQNRLDDSLEKVQSAIDKNRAAIQPRLQLALIYHRQGRLDDSLKTVNDVLIRAPKSAGARDLQGVVMMAKGDVTEAIEAFNVALELDSKLPSPYQHLADAYQKLGDYKQATAILQRGLENTGFHSMLFDSLIHVYEESGATDKIIEEYEKLYEQYPEQKQVINNLAMALVSYKSDASSLKRAHELVKKLETDSTVPYRDTVAWVMYKLGNVDKAVEILEEVVREDAQKPTYRYHLGMAYLERGDVEAAREQLSAAVNMGDFLNAEEAAAALRKIDNKF